VYTVFQNAVSQRSKRF